MESFNRNGLQFVRLEGSSAKGKREGVVKRFQEDPDVAAFFLHTRSQSAGLTLTCSRYVSFRFFDKEDGNFAYSNPFS